MNSVQAEVQVEIRQQKTWQRSKRKMEKEKPREIMKQGPHLLEDCLEIMTPPAPRWGPSNSTPNSSISTSLITIDSPSSAPVLLPNIIPPFHIIPPPLKTPSHLGKDHPPKNAQNLVSSVRGGRIIRWQLIVLASHKRTDAPRATKWKSKSHTSEATCCPSRAQWWACNVMVLKYFVRYK